MLLLALLVCLGHHFYVENPGNSIIGLYPRFQWLFKVLKKHGVADSYLKLSACLYGLCNNTIYVKPDLEAKVYKQKFWMRHWGHRNPKHSKISSTSPLIAAFNLGKLIGAQRKSSYKSAVAYVDKRGHKRWKGTKNLKGTGCFGQHYTHHACNLQACNHAVMFQGIH